MRIAEDVRAVWDQSWSTARTWPLLVAYNLSLGILLIVGGPERINGPSFTIIREVGNKVTGSVFIGVAVALVVAALIDRRVLGYAFMLASFAHLLLAAGFLAAILHEPPIIEGGIRPALTAVPTYLFVAATHFANAFVYGRRGPLGTRRRDR